MLLLLYHLLIYIYIVIQNAEIQLAYESHCWKYFWFHYIGDPVNFFRVVHYKRFRVRCARPEIDTPKVIVTASSASRCIASALTPVPPVPISGMLQLIGANKRAKVQVDEVLAELEQIKYQCVLSNDNK